MGQEMVVAATPVLFVAVDHVTRMRDDALRQQQQQVQWTPAKMLELGPAADGAELTQRATEIPAHLSLYCRRRRGGR